jgi:hypothetical protein
MLIVLVWKSRGCLLLLLLPLLLLPLKRRKCKKFEQKNNVLSRNKMMKSYTTSNFVNGPACSYAKLKTYANCARAEKPRVAAPEIPAAATVAAPAPAAPAAPAPAPAAPAAAAPAAPVAEGYYYLDPSVDSLPGNANSGEKNYTPSYTVPNYAPINTDSLITKDDASCGGYRKILQAYGGMDGSSCTTNYINN